jgi:hypothetical protein
MHTIVKAVLLGIILVASAIGSLGQVASRDARGSLIVVMKDGRRETIPVSEITKIEFKDADIVVFRDGGQKSFRMSETQSFEFDTSASTALAPGRNHFVGKWKVGQGPGAGNFYITLEANGEAHKSIGADHGTWTVVDGEARIAWDDGWHDVIRKVGTKHEKLAFEPGKSFSEKPNNVTAAVNTSAEPI